MVARFVWLGDSMGKKGEIKIFSVPLLLDGPNCERVLLVTEKGELALKLPQLELGDMPHIDAIQMFFEKAVPLPVEIVDIYNQYDYVVAGTKIREIKTVYIVRVTPEGEASDDVDMDNLNFGSTFLETAIMFDINTIVDEAKATESEIDKYIEPATIELIREFHRDFLNPMLSEEQESTEEPSSPDKPSIEAVESLVEKPEEESFEFENESAEPVVQNVTIIKIPNCKRAILTFDNCKDMSVGIKGDSKVLIKVTDKGAEGLPDKSQVRKVVKKQPVEKD